MQVMLCQSDLILLHKWGLDDSQSHTTVQKLWVLYIAQAIFRIIALHHKSIQKGVSLRISTQYIK